jgi:hypothetical protein
LLVQIVVTSDNYFLTLEIPIQNGKEFELLQIHNPVLEGDGFCFKKIGLFLKNILNYYFNILMLKIKNNILTFLKQKIFF